MSNMYVNEDKLPSLPIPELSGTKKKLLEWLAPILTEEQFASSKEKIDTFFAANGDGETLQTKLKAWDNNLEGSWLKPLWDDVYLMHRDSLPISSNFNVLLESIGENIDLAETIAKIGILTANYYHDIIDEKIEPELMRGQALDMGQYKNFFRSVRIPQKNRDDFYIAPYTKENNYLVALYRNHLLKVTITDEDGKLYDSVALASNIQAAMDEVKETAANGTVFTAADRETAAEVYNLLRESTHNKQLLDMIADALLIVSIDETSRSSVESIRSLMTSTDNKYFDKTVQIMLTKHGEIGFNMEHATIDGTSISSFIGYISKHLRENEQYEGSKTVATVNAFVWDLNKEMQAALQEVAATYTPLQENIALLFEQFTDFGAAAIKEMKLSPDGFFHMALQLAYFRTYGKFDSVYEPVAVRTFKEGRTECARATSTEKTAVVQAVEAGQVSNEDIYVLMEQASAAHADRLRQAQQGLGVERHLFGLEQMYHRFKDELGIEALPALFTDEGYKKLGHDSLSTSGMVYRNAIARMFAPTVSDGHGVAYIMTEDVITISISSFRHNEEKGAQLKDEMIKALKELATIARK